MSRRDARRHIFNLMFQNEFNKEINTHESIETYRNEYENFERKDILFIKNEYTGILENVEKIDSIIDKFSIGCLQLIRQYCVLPFMKLCLMTIFLIRFL